jgi:dienelactone hydrolase
MIDKTLTIKKGKDAVEYLTNVFQYIKYVLVLLIVIGLLNSCVTTKLDYYTDPEYVPANGRGPIVIMASGWSGIERYKFYAKDLAKLGYEVILMDGKGFSADNLRNAINRAQSSSHGLPGKVAVIGFSQGGYGVLSVAASMPDVVSAVIAYYPVTSNIWDMKKFASSFKAPTLILAGKLDTYLGCCVINDGQAQDMIDATKVNGVPFELIFYPKADHGFNLHEPLANYGNTYRPDDAADAWKRTVNMLSMYLPLH